MKTATKGAKPDWLERPANVIAVSVCQVSGMLPNSGCNTVEVMNRDGGTENRSMVYTEYFVKGTQPTSLCPLHPAPSFMDRLAGLFGGGHTDTPLAPEQIGLPPARKGTTSVSTPPAAPPDLGVDGNNPSVEEAPKKRGFWSRLFGRGANKSDKSDKRHGEKERKPGT
jgi:hypothetical protein